MDNLILEYIEETGDYLLNIEKHILEFEKAPDSKEILNILFRNFHSLKGLSGFVEMSEIFDIAHESETLLDMYRKKKISTDKNFFGLLLSSADIISESLHIIKEKEKIDDDAKIREHIEKIKKYIEEKKINGKALNNESLIPLKTVEENKTPGLKEEIKVKHNKKYLIYSIDNENYGIEINYVKEIIGIMNITAIPKVKKYIKGIINLRGKIIPVIDIRTRFDLKEEKYDERTCIIIIEAQSGSVKKNTGIVVDRVEEVIEISDENITPIQNSDMMIEDKLILGMAKSGEKLIMILDIMATVDIIK